MDQYLANSEHVDWKHRLVAAKAAELAEGCHSDEEVAKRCFEFVRDSIQHIEVIQANAVAKVAPAFC